MKHVSAIVVCVGLLLPALARAQAPAPSADTITLLLVEVRALRLAMERAATVGARIQLLVARVQLQEQRIAELSRRMVTVRDAMTRAETDMTQIALEMKRIEGAINSNNVPADERPHFERMIEGQKTQLAMTEKRRQDLANEEALLLQQIAADQGRWTDINGQLDQLEQSLTAPIKQ